MTSEQEPPPPLAAIPPDGKLVLFVADRDGTNARQLHADQAGAHNHFPAWSLDGKWLYFAHSREDLAGADLWRIAADGGSPERLTDSSICRANSELRHAATEHCAPRLGPPAA